MGFQNQIKRVTIKILLLVIKPIEFQLRGSEYDLVVLRPTMWYFVPVRSRKNRKWHRGSFDAKMTVSRRRSKIP